MSPDVQVSLRHDLQIVLNGTYGKYMTAWYKHRSLICRASSLLSVMVQKAISAGSITLGRS